MLCNNWLGLRHYKPGGFKSKTAWLGQQLDVLVSANKHALKLINKTTQHSKSHTMVGKNYSFLLGIMFYCVIILRVAIRFKTSTSLTFTWLLDHYKEPNVYYIQLLNQDCKSKPKVVNSSSDL